MCDQKRSGGFTVFLVICLLVIWTIGGLSTFYFMILPTLSEETTKQIVAVIEEGSEKDIFQKETLETEQPKAFLGVGYKHLGMEVINVYPGSPAEKAGLKKGDIVKFVRYTKKLEDRFDLDKQLRDFGYDIKEVVSTQRHFDIVWLVIERDGELMSMPITLKVAPSKEEMEKFFQQTTEPKEKEADKKE